MKYRLSVPRTWRYRDHKRGYRELAPGDYSVPDQVPQDIAERAVDQGMGTMTIVREPAKPDEPSPQPPQQPVTRGRRGRRKGPAPENKVGHVSENKTTLV